VQKYGVGLTSYDKMKNVYKKTKGSFTATLCHILT